MTELLAPAGDMKSFEAALACGANAVYLGLGDFNARMKAANFDIESLRELVKEAHFHGVKIYVTINTILQNSELKQMLSLVKAAISAKVDAFIVQDLGVCKLLSSCFDGIVLHASTQMGVHNAMGAKIAEKMGVKRVVLSRETTLQDIKDIRRETSLELEFFVQGALCVCFSGECYMSSVEQGASGNRGLCKQLCRLPYEARTRGVKKKGYLLSARDLCLAESIKQLRDAGVTSFKIEGRMRREGYVAKAVNVYRKFVYGAESRLSEKDRFSLQTAFSRGDYLERAYLDGGTPSVVEPRFNNHIGVEIGKVEAVRPFKKNLYEVILRLTRPISDGAGLKFFDGDVEAASLGVGGVREEGNGRYKFVTSTRLKEGLSVRLTLDRAEEDMLLSVKKTREITLKVVALQGMPLKMSAECTLYDFDGEFKKIYAEAYSTDALERAQNAPVSKDTLREQAKKTQYAGFVATSCEVQTDGIFVPISVVNSVRRELLQKLADSVVAAYEKNEVVEKNIQLECLNFEKYSPAKAERALKVVFSEEPIEVLKKGEIPVLAPSDYTAREVTRMCAALGFEPQEVALKLPPLACGQDIARINALLGEVPIKTLVAHNIYALGFAERGYKVIAGEGMNIANDFAAIAVTELGANAVVPSLEFGDSVSSACAEDQKESDFAKCDAQNADEQEKNYKRCEFSPRVRVYSSDRRHPLMTLAHCPFKTLFNNDCGNCMYSPDLTLIREKHVYRVRRVRMSRCIFELYAAVSSDKTPK